MRSSVDLGKRSSVDLAKPPPPSLERRSNCCLECRYNTPASCFSSQVVSLQSCGADPRGVRVMWRDGGRRTHLVRVTELGRMLGTDPNMALSVLYGLGRWEAGRSGGGMGPQRRGWVRVGEEGGESSSRRSSSSTSSSTSNGARAPPPRPPRNPEAPPLQE